MTCFTLRRTTAVLLWCALLPLTTAAEQEPRVPGSTREDPPARTTGRVVVVSVGNQMPFYSPADVTAHVGDTIVWRNSANADTHAVISIAGGFSSSDIPAGQEWQTTITAPGELTYVCRYHPWMRGKITANWPSAEFAEHPLADAPNFVAAPDRAANPRAELPAGAEVAAMTQSPDGHVWWLDRGRRKLATIRDGWIIEHPLTFELDAAPALIAGDRRVWFPSRDGYLNWLEDGRMRRLALPQLLRDARFVGDGTGNVWALRGGSAWLLKQPASQ